MESEASVPVYTKCKPGVTLLIPWKFGADVNESRSRPMKVFGGRDSIRMVGESMVSYPSIQ